MDVDHSNGILTMQNLRSHKPKKCCQKCVLGTVLYILIIFLLLFIVVFIILPVTFKYSVGIQRNLIFPTWAVPPDRNYSDIEQFGITGVRNFYVTVKNWQTSIDENENITLGVWQILPFEMLSDLINNEDYNYEGVLNNVKYDILIYLHGNAHDRTMSVEKYTILRKYFHIFAVDYRGYADSTKADLTETNIVNDMVEFYKWLNNRTNSNIYVWGHSLGSSIGTHMLTHKSILGYGLVLETPFTSVVDVIASNPLVKSLCGWLPWFRTTILQPMIDHDFNFDTQKYITEVDSPIMILHAKDDSVIPYSFATELYDTAVDNRNYTYQGNITYHLFESLGYDHMLIYKAPELPEYVENFVEDCNAFKKKIKWKNL